MNKPSGPQPQRTPAVGELVVDARRERVGEVTGTGEGRVWLRPPAGGDVWEALPCDVRPATEQDTRSVYRPSRCVQCREIKRKRSLALGAGDLKTAVELTEAMGVHLRVAHS
ncbi:hypothetical protein [Streptomyces sp. I05A-00742]|uniref:hypothetical protein n=1 Tax=Streptomyces sp. I05A-00742 TaxID=2732853 RepID=UPI001BB2CC62|nr:hypothetical protein [Streptomyces sp. I05A-00742]